MNLLNSTLIARHLIRGVYAVTPEWSDPERICQAASAALAGGIRLLQLRHKGEPAQRHALAKKLLALCDDHNACLIINDDLELAIDIQAHGVHLGQHDGSLAHARAHLHTRQMLGASCYNRLDLAHAAVAEGADYIAFGSVFASPTKPQAVHAPLELFRQTRALQVPCVGIGGITLDNASDVLQAGAHAVAVITDVFEQEDIEARARAWVTAVKSTETRG